jgi:hypothetical protein
MGADGPAVAATAVTGVTALSESYSSSKQITRITA